MQHSKFKNNMGQFIEAMTKFEIRFSSFIYYATISHKVPDNLKEDREKFVKYILRDKPENIDITYNVFCSDNVSKISKKYIQYSKY